MYIFEELEPVIEEQVKAWGIQKAVGKEIFTIQGEYSANMIRERVLGEKPDIDSAASVPARPPILCPGCPHRSVFTVLNKLRIHAAGDIGCYTLGAVAPLSVIDITICMGASISTLHGMEKPREKITSKIGWRSLVIPPLCIPVSILSSIWFTTNPPAQC